MKAHPEPLSAAVRQFRELTAADVQGGATRARVLTGADHRIEARHRWRRTTVTAGVVVTILGSAAIGASRVGAWRGPAPIVLAPEPGGVDARSVPAEDRPRRVIPTVLASESPLPALADDDEAALYGRAHAAHFGAARPDAALSAWNDYLRVYPHGRFEPEARFNRAICLVRLRRFASAVAALAPFARGRFGDYRRAEAAQLLDWMKGAHSSTAAGR